MVGVLIMRYSVHRHSLLRHAVLLVMTMLIRHAHGGRHLRITITIREEVRPIPERVRRCPHGQVRHLWRANYGIVGVKASED